MQFRLAAVSMRQKPLTYFVLFVFLNDTATTEIYTLSLHDALPIWFLSCQRDQFLPQRGVRIRLRLVSITTTIHLQQLAGPALAHMALLHRQRHILPLAYKLQPFFRITTLSASLSRLRSATICFSRRFSSSSSRSRRASLTSIPPYFDFHVYSVASLTPTSRASSPTFRPPSICFNTPMICSSLCRLFFITELLLVRSSYRSSSSFNWRSLSGAGQRDSGIDELLQ